MAENDPQVVVINATIFPWQREALVRRQRELGLLSLSETLRSLLSEVLPRPVCEPVETAEAVVA